MWGPMYVGMESSLDVSYVNKGKTTIHNLEISVEGENLTATETKSYVGNVESGSSDYYSVNIMANQEGPVKGKVKFSYEDANGQTVEVVKEFESEAMMMNYEPEDPGMIEPLPEENTGLPLWGKILIGVVVIGGIAAVAFVVIKKKKAAKAKREETETYDDFPEDGE